jgi:hypothetical protein
VYSSCFATCLRRACSCLLLTWPSSSPTSAGVGSAVVLSLLSACGAAALDAAALEGLEPAHPLPFATIVPTRPKVCNR